MFNNNLFLNVPQKADLSATVREASEAWQNGVFTWNAWVKEFLAHQQNITLSGDFISDEEFLTQSMKACLSQKLSFEDVQMFEGAESGNTHLQMNAKLTDKLNGSEKSYHICLTLAENIFSCRYETEIISPEMKDVTVCRCAERRSAKKLIPAFA